MRLEAGGVVSVEISRSRLRRSLLDGDVVVEEDVVGALWPRVPDLDVGVMVAEWKGNPTH